MEEKDAHVHNPDDFSFIKTSKLKGISNGAYAYPGRLDFSQGAVKIYKTNREVYKGGEYVDAIVSCTLGYSGYKVAHYVYLLGRHGLQASMMTPVWAGMWSFALFYQFKYLMATYLTTVFMIDEIELLDDMKHIRVSTVLNNTTMNVFAQAKLKLDSNHSDLAKVYVFPIEECEIASDDRPDSPWMRLSIVGRKFFLHRNRTELLNTDLVKAVFTKEVTRIENLR